MMKKNRTINKWAVGILAVLMMSASPWVASVHAELSEEKQANILALCMQEGEDSAAITALKEELQGLTEDEIYQAYQSIIESASDDRRSTASARYVAAAIETASASETLDVITVAQQLGSRLVQGVEALGITGNELQNQLGNIIFAARQAALGASSARDRAGVAKRFAYGLSRSASPDLRGTISRAFERGDDYTPPIIDDPDTSPSN